ncbi:MAG: hypothetical protein GF411_15260 [Candidatus Lokiarchaeota archaeon]|nr:hypothetical protein [Candidatus Lokiarchaeota archaeon]
MLFGVVKSDLDDYIKNNNYIKVFVNNELFHKYKIINVDTDVMMGDTTVIGVGMSETLKESITDASSYSYTDTTSEKIISDLASGLITIKENMNLGNVTHDWNFLHKLDGMMQVVEYFDGDWWIGWEHPFDTDYLYVVDRKGVASAQREFYNHGSKNNIFNSELIFDRESFSNSVTIVGPNNTPNTTISAVSTYYTNLASDTNQYTSGPREYINVQMMDATEFPSLGILKIGDEYIPYDALSGNGIDETRDIEAGFITSGDAHRKNTLVFCCYDGTGKNNSPLNSDITNSDSTITLNDASSFDSSGSVIIGNEIITYTGISGNDLTGCTRGTSDTIAKAHNGGVVVIEYDSSKHYTKTSPQTGSLISTWGLRTKKLKDLGLTSAMTGEAFASRIIEPALDNLSDTKGGLATVKFNCADITEASENKLGDVIYIDDYETEIQERLRILSMELKRTAKAGEELVIEAGNDTVSFVKQLIEKLQYKYG